MQNKHFIYSAIALSCLIATLTSCSKNSLESYFGLYGKDTLSPLEMEEIPIGESLQKIDHISILAKLGNLEKDNCGHYDLNYLTDCAFVLNGWDKLNGLKDQFGNEVVFPEFDFSKYSIVIGRYGIPYSWVETLDEKLIKEKEKLSLFLKIGDYRGGLMAPSYNLILSVYPKLPDLPIEVFRLDIEMDIK